MQTLPLGRSARKPRTRCHGDALCLQSDTSTSVLFPLQTYISINLSYYIIRFLSFFLESNEKSYLRSHNNLAPVAALIDQRIGQGDNKGSAIHDVATSAGSDLQSYQAPSSVQGEGLSLKTGGHAVTQDFLHTCGCAVGYLQSVSNWFAVEKRWQRGAENRHKHDFHRLLESFAKLHSPRRSPSGNFQIRSNLSSAASSVTQVQFNELNSSSSTAKSCPADAMSLLFGDTNTSDSSQVVQVNVIRQNQSTTLAQAHTGSFLGKDDEQKRGAVLP